MTRKIIAVFNDTQCGSSLGLAAPHTTLNRYTKEGDMYEVSIELNPAQQYLYDVYTWGRQEVMKLAGKSDVHLFVNGDMTQGDRFREELSHALLDDQVRMATDVILQWKSSNLKSVRLTKSTRVHAFNDGQADAMVTRNVKDNIPNTRLVSHGRAKVGGVLVDYAHHGPPAGVRSWLKGNLLRYNTKSMIDTCIKDNEPVPDVVLRAHKHERVEEWVTDWRRDERVRVLACTVPSFQMMTSHAQKATNSEPKVVNGMLAIEVEAGRVRDVHWFAKMVTIPTSEVL